MKTDIRLSIFFDHLLCRALDERGNEYLDEMSLGLASVKQGSRITPTGQVHSTSFVLFHLCGRALCGTQVDFVSTSSVHPPGRPLAVATVKSLKPPQIA